MGWRVPCEVVRRGTFMEVAAAAQPYGTDTNATTGKRRSVSVFRNDDVNIIAHHRHQITYIFDNSVSGCHDRVHLSCSSGTVLEKN